MSLNRRRAVIASVTAFLLLLGLAPLATAGDEGSNTGGTTSARVQILDVELTHVPVVGDVAAVLGVATGDAKTIGRPFASVGLEGVRIGDRNLGGESVTSDDEDNAKSVEIPLAVGGIGGTLTIAELAASATKESAMSTLRGLEGELSLDALGLTSVFGGQGIDSHVTPKISTSDVGIDIGPIGLQLGDLLPAEVLEALPFSTVVALARDLDLDVSGALREVRGVLRQVNDQIDAIQATATDLEDAQAALDALIAQNPEIAALQAQVDEAAATVSTATASLQQEEDQLADLIEQREALEAQLAGCTVLCDVLQAQLAALNSSIESQEQEVAAAESQLAAATAALEDAESALAAAIAAAGDALQQASDLVDQLQAELEGLLDDLEGLLGDLPDLSALLEGALEALEDAPLVSVRELKLGVETLADAKRGFGDAACSAEGVNVLGTSLGEMSCEALTARFDELQSGIFAVLNDLPVAGSLPRPTVAGLAISESGSTAPDARGRTASDASITALRLGVPSLELEAVIDSLVADVTQQLEDLLAGTPLAPALDDAVNSVLEQLDSLPTGALLAGLRTVGVDAAVGGLTSASEFLPGGGAGTDPTDDALGSPPAGSDPDPDPQENAPLPFTGATYVVAFLALALLAIVAGVTASFVPALSRPRRDR